jgi:hypothetical protein
MPPQDRVRPNDAGQTEQAGPEPSHQRDQGPVTATQSRTMRCTSKSDIQLMPKKDILDFKPVWRLAQSGDKRRKQMEDGKHRAA